MTVVTKEMMRFAKGLIQRRGWCQGDDQAFDPARRHGYCVGTALGAACDERERFDSRHALTMAHLFKTANGLPMEDSIGNWNDAPERTKAEVLDAFDVAIEKSADQVVKGQKPRREKQRLTPRQSS